MASKLTLWQTRPTWKQTIQHVNVGACRNPDDGFRRLMEIAPEGVVILMDRRIIFANQAYADQLGATHPTEIIGRNGLNFVVPADRERIAARIRQLHEDGGQSGLTRYQRTRLDGQIADVEAVAVRIIWEDKPAILSMVRDVTARLRAEARLEGFLDTAATCLWETDTEHRLTYLCDFNQCDVTQAHVLGKTRWELHGVNLDTDEIWRAHVADLEARRPFRDFEFRAVAAPWLGQHRSLSGKPVFDAHGGFKGYRGTSHDITERKRAEQTIAHMALHDALTSLPNRVYFTGELERAFSAAHRDDTKIAVLFLDLDHFKDINDTLGHSVGDKLLIEVANRLKSCQRGGDLVARFGGDEFVMVATQPYDPASIRYLADRITRTVAAPYGIDGHTVHTSVSIGIAIYPDDGLDTERILANADLALYTAKRAGRETWRVFDHCLQEQLQAQRSLDQELRHALDRQQFELYYQPLLSIAEDRISGFEALIRWNHPKHGQMLPDRFIPAAEQNRLIIPLTEWVLQEAVTQLQRWASIGLNEHKVAVNVSPILLKLQGFVDLFDRCIGPTGCDPRRLVIEITEGALIDEAKVTPALTALQERGATIAIDDFGMGYSSMVRLKRLPVDVLKIDRSFITNVTEDGGDAMIVESLVNVGHGLGKKVVAEGVETVEQLRFLENVGCDVAQGFFIHRPIAATDMRAWFKQWQSSRLGCASGTDP